MGNGFPRCGCVLLAISLLAFAYMMRLHVQGGFDSGKPSEAVVQSDYPAKLVKAHKYAIRDLAVTPDGRYCATVDGMAHGFAVTDLQESKVHTTFRGAPLGEFAKVAISQTGAAAALATNRAAYLAHGIGSGELTVSDWTELPASRRHAILFADDGRTLFCGSCVNPWAYSPTGDTSMLQEWSAEGAEKLVRRWYLPKNLRLEGLHAVLISHPRAFFLGEDKQDGSQAVWVCELSPSGGDSVHRVSEDAGGLLAADRQGRTLAVRIWRTDQIEFYDTAVWHVRHVAQCVTNTPEVTIDGANDRYALAEKSVLQVASLSDGAPMGKTEVAGGKIRNPRFTADGQRLVASVGGCILVVDCERSR